jgi:hypothetical protein
MIILKRILRQKRCASFELYSICSGCDPVTGYYKNGDLKGRDHLRGIGAGWMIILKGNLR